MNNKYIRKIGTIIIIVLSILCIFKSEVVFGQVINNTVKTEESKIQNELKNKLLEETDIDGEMDKLYNYINKMKTDNELLRDLNPKEYFDQYMETGNGTLSFEEITDCIVSYIFKELKSVVSMALSLLVVALICALLKNLQTAFSSESISNIAFYACYALLMVMLAKSFLVSIDLAKNVITEITNFTVAVLPILVIMLGASGGFTQAATMDPIILGATILIPRLYLNIIIPLILMTFVLQFANNISTEHKLDSFCKLLRQSTLWLQGITLTIFIGLLTIRGITASTIDAVTLKTAKFAVDNFIPIVGKSFSDAIATVAGYSLVIKNAVSTIGLVVIILLMLYPVIKLFLMSLVYKLTAAVMEPIGDKRLVSSVQNAGEAVVLIMSCVLSVSLMFFILIAIMASAGKFVIGG